ncbi:MAG: NmrA family NAD(P)-binding protein, partial [Actinomycetota bacterium]
MCAASRPGPVVVAGAAGKTGRAVADAFEAAGHEVRRLTRIDGDLADPATLLAATVGASALYHLAPNMSPDEEVMGAHAIAAARANDLRLVFHSVLAPAIEAMPHHWRKARVEAALHAAPDVRWTILQPAPYLQNLAPFIDRGRTTGRFRLPYDPASALAMVDLADVGAAAVAVLDDDRHVHATWELCGEAG